MTCAHLRPLWLGGLLLSLIVTPALAQQPERQSAQVQKVKNVTAHPEAGIRMPQQVGELVDPDLPTEAIAHTSRPRRLQTNNARLDAALIAIVESGAFPVLVFDPRAVERVVQTPSPVVMRPARGSRRQKRHR